jgi:hypothetical protein
MITITPLSLTAWEFPEDKVAGKAAFIAQWENPIERWIRAYALTMRELVSPIIEANKIAPQHLYVDKSCMSDAPQKVIVDEIVAGGVEVTIGTSPAGPEFIAHTKSVIAVNGDSWEGSTNFSESAWSQVNTAFQFTSLPWAVMMVIAFNRDVVYAWEHYPTSQLISEQPTPSTIA